jgi:hypothetical protein
MDKPIDHSPGTNWRFMLCVTVKLVEGFELLHSECDLVCVSVF